MITASSRVLLIVLLLSCATAPAKLPIVIDFTAIPKGGEGSSSRGDIAGRVTGIDSPEKYKIVLYAHTDKWYVQPLTSDPMTDITPDGAWSNWTHLGHRYGALVVQRDFRPPDITQALPSVGGMVLARGEVAARDE